MKSACRWTAVILTAALLVLFVYGLITVAFVSAKFWLLYCSLAVIDWLVIRCLNKSLDPER